MISLSAGASSSTPSISIVDDARADHVRAHPVEERREVGDLGLAGRVLDHGRALGEHRRAHEVLGGADTRELEQHPRARAAASQRACTNPCATSTSRAHRLEPAQVHVDLAAADVVAAGQRDPRLAAAREQRTEHVERRAHARRPARTALRAVSVAGRVDPHDVGRGLVDASRRSRAAGRSSRRGRAPAACCAAS